MRAARCDTTGLSIPECSCRACLLYQMRKHGTTQMQRILGEKGTASGASPSDAGSIPASSTSPTR